MDQNKLKVKTILEENRILEFYATEGGTICDKSDKKSRILDFIKIS